MLRHELMDFMFADPTMLDDMDFLFKSDLARRLMFYHQEEWKPDPPVDRSKLGSRERHDDTQRPKLLKIQGKGKQKETGDKDFKRKVFSTSLCCDRQENPHNSGWNRAAPEWDQCLYSQKLL